MIWCAPPPFSDLTENSTCIPTVGVCEVCAGVCVFVYMCVCSVYVRAFVSEVWVGVYVGEVWVGVCTCAQVCSYVSWSIFIPTVEVCEWV